MRIAFVILLILAIGTGAFAGWGLFTAHGRQRFDEMAGVVSIAALLAGVIVLVSHARSR